VRLNAEGQRFSASDVPFSDIRSVATFHNTLADPYLGTQTVPGNLYFNHTLAPASDLTGDGPGLRWVSGPYPLIPVKSPLLTDIYPVELFKLKRRDIKDKDGKVIDSVLDGTATLDVEPGILLVGDLVTARQDVPLDVLLHGTAGLGGPLLLGRVIMAMDPAHVPLQISWGRGHRVFGKKFKPGTYIKEVDYGRGRIELSINTLDDSLDDASISDAVVQEIEQTT
jgi:hypothetical protein